MGGLQLVISVHKVTVRSSMRSCLLSRIGLRLGAAHLKKSALDHKPRTPWAVKNMKEEMLANERKPWQPPRQSQFSNSDEDEARPKACVGICYYNKLMALEAKEDLASHNLVYKDQADSDPCDINDTACNEIEEDIIFNKDEKEEEDSSEKSSDNNLIVIDDDDQSGERRKNPAVSDTDTIYIDENNEDQSFSAPTIDIRQRHQGFV